MPDQCNTIFIGHGFCDPKDANGCLKPNGHFDHHVFKAATGELIAWQYDETCKCGCWKQAGDDEIPYTDVCMVYWEVKSINE